jgi:predicted amidophosphoribosyltransferase
VSIRSPVTSATDDVATDLRTARTHLDAGRLFDAAAAYQAALRRAVDPTQRRIATNALERLKRGEAFSGSWSIEGDDQREQILRQLVASDWLRPIIRELACTSCLSPTRRRPHLCPTCTARRDRIGRPLESLEAVTADDTDGPFHSSLRVWKRHGTPVWRTGDALEVATGASSSLIYAAVLSAYLDAQRHRLTAADEVLLTVPSRHSVVIAAMETARHHEWYAPEVVSSGAQPSDARPQRHATAAARAEVGSEFWPVPDELRGRDVVLLDDVLTTGATLFGYAAALRSAGVVRVRAVVLERIVSGNVYAQALDAQRREGTMNWHPAQSVVASA